MSDLDRFEARLAASLRLLADEVPSDVDAVELTASTARLAGGRRLQADPGTWWLRRPMVLAALAVMALLALLVGSVAAPRPVALPRPLSHGALTCDRASDGTLPEGAVELACTASFADPALRGRAWLALEPAGSGGDVATRIGRIRLQGDGARRSGTLILHRSPEGLMVGDASVAPPDGGAPVQLHLLTTDGVTWGVLAWAGSQP